MPNAARRAGARRYREHCRSSSRPTSSALRRAFTRGRGRRYPPARSSMAPAAGCWLYATLRRRQSRWRKWHRSPLLDSGVVLATLSAVVLNLLYNGLEPGPVE